MLELWDRWFLISSGRVYLFPLSQHSKYCGIYLVYCYVHFSDIIQKLADTLSHRSERVLKPIMGLDSLASLPTYESCPTWMTVEQNNWVPVTGLSWNKEYYAKMSIKQTKRWAGHIIPSNSNKNNTISVCRFSFSLAVEVFRMKMPINKNHEAVFYASYWAWAGIFH